MHFVRACCVRGPTPRGRAPFLGLSGRGCLRARAPPSTAAVPCCPVGSPIVARRQGSARGVHALPLTQRGGPYTQAPRFFSCCRAPPSRASNSVWARPLTVPCFLGTAQQGRKGHNTMYITGNAAVATAVANYRRSLALASMAMANYQVLLKYASDHKRLPPERLRATWRGCITLRNQLQANADAALAVGGITWEEHQAAYRI